ncbi:hypothetical protein [Streptomyces phaeofaciens]|nr:hypothetical protein [Streptomyces phaeofaciens]
MPILVVPLVLFAGACGTDSPEATASPGQATPSVTAEQALQVFDDVASHAARSNGNEFCKRFAYQVEACEGVWKEADDFCLKPGAKPRVIRSAPVRSTKESAGGRVLELEGLTAGGQRYVSEFFVTVADGNPRASVGVYWTGLGLAESPLGDGNTVLPTSECA